MNMIYSGSVISCVTHKSVILVFDGVRVIKPAFDQDLLFNKDLKYIASIHIEIAEMED